MVLRIRAFQIIAFIVITICFSCEEAYIANCDECSTSEPEYAELHIQISDDPNSGSTKVKIYEGDLEDDILFNTLTIMSLEHKLSVPLNKRYTVTASYNMGDEIYTAVDSAFPRIKYEEDQCDDPCYYVYDNKVNLRLKKY